MNPQFIQRFRSADVLNFLKEPLNDLCISRPKDRLSWGIELPFDKEFVTYVWFDALVNYISAVGYNTDTFNDYWPADYHVIGKDILSPPHAVYWPIMLKALDIDIPKHFLVHGWWLNSGAKMSKSKGDTINPLDITKKYGSDAFRYFLIKEMNVGQDSEFSLDLFLKRYNSDLANDLGNLLSRLLNMGHRFSNGIIPKPSIKEEPEINLIKEWKELEISILDLYDGFLFNKALEKIFLFISAINKYTEIRAPWKLSKSQSESDIDRLNTTLAFMSEGLRLCAKLLNPFMPNVSFQILQSLGKNDDIALNCSLEWGDTLTGLKFGEKIILFPKNDC